MSALLTDQEWQIKAACRGPHSTVFFPPGHLERKDEKQERERRAKAICANCGVRGACLEYALEIREQHGIWGGLSEAERRALTAEREAARAR